MSVVTTDNVNAGDAYLFTWEDNNGVCLGLPRVTGNLVGLFGLICLGKTSSKVCYFDNPAENALKSSVNDSGFFSPQESSAIEQDIELRVCKFKLDNPINMLDFVGGQTLGFNNQGVCTDCHAGMNPFVVHAFDAGPFQSLLAGVELNPVRWPASVDMPSDWPQNPGPLRNLGPVGQGELGCSDCHKAENATLFPLLSKDLPGYCGNEVIEAAISVTMPSAGNENAYAAQIARIRKLCGTENSTPITVPNVNGDDPNYLSPPIIEEPLYGCAKHIGVKGVRNGATVNLYFSSNPGVPFETKVVETQGKVDIPLDFELVAGDNTHDTLRVV